MGQALYRKYRSKSLDELVGQEHITRTLDKAIKSGRIAHAYLFTGPRGVGKTSTARILAHAINDLPYGDEQTHLDIIEIDAASNNSVEDVRDLREKVYIAPSVGKYKVYIIDEVHMLSKAAFNAILKTLEEPPAHAIFILATTEAHKLPQTIVSRTQRFVFRPIAPEQAVKHLRTIADTEHIDISDDALQLLAAHGDGSFRDSISLLDQASSLGKKITVTDVQSLLGIPSGESVATLLAAITASPVRLGEAMQTLYELYGQGFQASAIAHQLSAQLRANIVVGHQAPASHLIRLLDKLLEVSTKRDPERYLEIVILGLGSIEVPASQTATLNVAGTPPTKPATPESESKHHKATASDKPAAAEPPKSPAIEAPKAAKPVTEAPKDPELAPDNPVEAPTDPPTNTQAATGSLDVAIWPEVLNELKKQYNTLYGIIRMADVRFVSDSELQLGFAFAFHQKRVNESKNRQIIGEIIEKLTGRKVQITCTHDPGLKDAKSKTGPVAPTADKSQAESGEPLSAISNIFGGGELLQ